MTHVPLAVQVLWLVIALITVGGFAWLVVRARGRERDLQNQIDSQGARIANAEGNADSWHDERDAFSSKAERLTQDLADERVHHAQEVAAVNAEQTEIRHALKSELAAKELELAAEKQRPDQAVVVEALRTMNDANAANTQAILATQERIAETLGALPDRVAAKVAEKVGEVVQEKLSTEGGKS